MGLLWVVSHLRSHLQGKIIHVPNSPVIGLLSPFSTDEDHQIYVLGPSSCPGPRELSHDWLTPLAVHGSPVQIGETK